MSCLTKRIVLAMVWGHLVTFSVVASAQELGQDAAALPYRLDVSDVVSVKYRLSPEYDGEATVSPDGRIALPLLGELEAEGLTLAELEARIVAQASRRLRDPEVVVALREFRHPKVTVLGEVTNPGAFDMRGSLGVLDAMALAGGLKSSAKHSQVILLRRQGEGFVTREVDLKSMLRSRSPNPDLALRADDVLFVPQSRISKLQNLLPLAALSVLISSIAY